MPTLQARFWVWTLNNPTEGEAAHLQNLLASVASAQQDLLVRFLTWQLEQGEEGTPHYQGYVEFKQKRTMNQVKNQLGTQRLHLEVRRGTSVEAIEYCQKEDTRIDGPWTAGTPSEGQGERTDITKVKEMIDRGASEIEVAEASFALWCVHHRAFLRYKVLKTPDRDFQTLVTVVVGPPGTGKSRYANERDKGAFWKQHGTWWCGYEGHSTVVLDDFYGWLPWNTLLQISDRYPLRVQTKSGQAKFVATELIFTSNKHPATWYKNCPIKAFIRRVTKWIYMGEHGLIHETESYEEFMTTYERNHPTMPFVQTFNPAPGRERDDESFELNFNNM